MRRFIILLVVSVLGSSLLPAQGRFLRPTFAPAKENFVWDERNAAHFMRRAGFSASPSRIDAIVAQGFLSTLDRMIDPASVDDSAMEAGLAEKNFPLSRLNSGGRVRANALGLNQWWLYRMVHSENQLLEKMTLFWHDHFATSVAEVRFVKQSGDPLMKVQNDTLREYALGNFKEMVRAIARDPAMIIWLDNFLNVQFAPNENWARELLELFTMGVDQYTQQDIEEAARAFTGWTLAFERRDPDAFDFDFAFREELHDFGEKTFLGETGPLNGDDIIDIVFERDVTAEFIAKKLWEFFVYPNPDAALVRELGKVFRESGYETSVLMRAIFRHPEFFSDRAFRSLMKSPTELAVNFMRELELDHPDVLPFFLEEMNMYLFAPPDVGGWTSGVGWVNTSTLLSRYNFYNSAISFRGEVFTRQGSGGRDRRFQISQVDLEGIIGEFGLVTAEDVVNHFVSRMVQDDVTPDIGIVLEDYLSRNDEGVPGEFDITDAESVDKKVRGLLYLVALLPAYQLN